MNISFVKTEKGVLVRVLRNGLKCIQNHKFRIIGFHRAPWHPPFRNQRHDSSVGIALGYGLDDRGSRVRFPAGAGNFSLHHRIHNGSGAYPASYPMGTR
jgi:hypothetical protein